MGLYTYSQSNKADSLHYHFSLKNGWALKLNALQPFVIGEFRFGLEKRVRSDISIEVIESFYVSKFQRYYYDSKSKSFEGQYSGKRNYKVGLGFNFYPDNLQKLFVSFQFIFRHYQDIRTNYVDDSPPYRFAKGIIYDYKDSYKVILLQTTINRRVSINGIYTDIFLGVGGRVKLIKSEFIPHSIDYQIISKNWEFYQQQINLLYQPIHLKVFPTIQFGVNIGIQSKQKTKLQ